MSFPNIPNITPQIDISRTEAINLILASIAFEELSLAHIINAEAEKIQFVLGSLDCHRFHNHTTISELFEISKSAERMFRTIINKQILLQFKLEDILNIIDKEARSFDSTY